MKKSFKLCMGLVFCLVLIFALCFTYSLAQEKMKIGGETTAKYLTREVKEIGDAEGHTLVLSTLEGISKSIGEQTFMEGAKVLITGVSDTTQGNGIVMGYVKMVKGEDVVFAKYKGKVTTVLTDGNPVTTFEVEAEFIKGEGKYANIQGGYKSKAKTISEDELSITWEGAYFIKK